MKRNVRSFCILFLGAAALAASAAALAPSTPLIVDGPIVVDAADFEGNILRIPEDKRGSFRISYDRVVSVIDNIFVARTLAARARKEGLDQDPAVQRRLQQLQDGLLADLYLAKIEAGEAKIDFEQRAREVFKADRASLAVPEQIYLQDIFIGTDGRTHEMAAELARKARDEALKPGADFLAVAAKYSEDPAAKENGGDWGYQRVTSIPEPIRKVAATLKRKDEVSQPIDVGRGFHIVRFIDRKPPHEAKYEEVRDKLIAAEKEKAARAAVERAIREVRSSPTVVVHRENVEKLVIPVDPAALTAAQDAGAKAPPKR